MLINDDKIYVLETQIANAESIKELIASKGWQVFTNYIKDVHEKKILDTFRRIPGNSQYDAGFRILQGEYQMMGDLLRVPYEIIEVGEQAKKNLENLREA